MASIITAGNATNGLAISSDGTGILNIKTGTGAGTTAMTIDASQNVAVTGNLTLTGNASGVLKSGTAVASTSGTSIDFTGIPSTAKRITVMLNGVSKSSTANFLFQLGDSGGIETTGYTGQGGAGNTGNIFITVSSTSGFPTAGDASGAVNVSGSIVFTNITGNTWISAGTFYTSIGYSTTVAGDKTLSATLDRVRITTTSGTDTFDAGTINILWE